MSSMAPDILFRVFDSPKFILLKIPICVSLCFIVARHLSAAIGKCCYDMNVFLSNRFIREEMRMSNDLKSCLYRKRH